MIDHISHEMLSHRISDALFHSNTAENYQRALYAVVQLHRPEHLEHGQYKKCWNCRVVYPCPTMDAIERHLING